MKPNDQLEPTVFVIFGGAGDLTWRQLVPALFDLSQDRSLPAEFAIIAVDRVNMSDDALRRRFHDRRHEVSASWPGETAAHGASSRNISTTNRAISRSSTPIGL